MDKNQDIIHTAMCKLRASIFDMIDMSGLDDIAKASWKRLIRDSTSLCWEFLKTNLVRKEK